MWTRKYVKAFTKYGRKSDDQIQLRRSTKACDILIKVLNTGGVEVSQNGTAHFDSIQAFEEFYTTAVAAALDAKVDLDKHLIV